MRNNKHKNNMIIGGLLAIVLVMGIGYAAFSSKLSINGTGSVSSNFDVKITGITSKNIVGKAGNKTNPTYTDTTATFYTTLQSPGDSITYDITVANNGTFDAILNDITTTNGNNSAITFETSGLSKGDSLLKGETKTLTVKVTYNSSVTTQPSNTTNTLKVTLTFGQKGLDSNGLAVIPVKDQIMKKEAVVTSGDGLYEDSVTEGRYFYRGSNPNNYITFNDETWRIISIENDGTLKIIRDEQLIKLPFDENGNRSSSENTYFRSGDTSGHAWAATKNLVGTPSEFKQYEPNGNVTDSYSNSGTVVKDASLNTYLNETYYNSLPSKARSQVEKGVFNVSTPGNRNDMESLEIDAQQEAQYQWKGYVALYTVTELLRASTYNYCMDIYRSWQYNYCSRENWLWTKKFDISSVEWLLSPYADSTVTVYGWGCNLNGYTQGAEGNTNTFMYEAIRPVLHLSSSIKLSGTGSSSDPYKIVS